MKPAFVRQGGVDLSHFDTRRDTGIPGASLIMTLDGECEVAGLRPGARIITRDSGTAVLRRVRRRRIVARSVQVRAGSLGHNRPDHDAVLAAGQPVLVRDWRAQALFGAPQALVTAERLVDGQFVTLRAPAPLVLHDLEFDTPHVLYVDGLEVASALVRFATT